MPRRSESVFDQPIYGEDFGLQHGVITGGLVTRDSASQVTVPAGRAWIAQPSGLLRRVTWPATVLSAIPAGVANGRVDQWVVNSDGVVSRLAGTNAGTAISTLDDANATGSRAAVPLGSLRLGEAVVDNTGVLSTAGTKFRDRRAWARGMNYTLKSTNPTGVYGSGGWLTSEVRFEVSGTAPQSIRVFSGLILPDVQRVNWMNLYIDGVSFRGSYSVFNSVANSAHPITLTFDDLALPAGSHTARVYGGGTVGGEWYTFASATRPLVMTVREDTRPSVSNGIV